MLQDVDTVLKVVKSQAWNLADGFVILYLFMVRNCFLFAEERADPELLAKSPSRRRRVAMGSGRSQEQVDCKFLTTTVACIYPFSFVTEWL